MNRSDHYAFAHDLLPHLLFHQEDIFFQEMNKGYENFLDYLKWIWQESLGEEDRPLPDFHFFLLDLNTQIHLCLIEMPEPEMVTDPLYIGIVYGQHMNSRYFLYEVGFSFDQLEQIHHEMDVMDYLDYLFVCEWTPSREHYNYGSHQDPKISYFVEQIKEILGLY